MHITFLDPAIRAIVPDATRLLVPAGSDLVDVLASLDEDYMRRPIKAKRGDVILRSLLQLVWNARTNKIYDDIGIDARDENHAWLPLRDDPLAMVPDGSSIVITPDPGC